MSDVIPAIPGEDLATVNAWLLSFGLVENTAATYARAYFRVLPWLKAAGGPGRVRSDLAGEIVLGLSTQYGAATVKLTISAMSSLWQELIRRQIVTDNPWRMIKRPRVKMTVGERIMREGEARDVILAATKPRDRALLRFLYHTGARVSETVLVTWQDYRTNDEGTHYVTLYGKGGRTRIVQVADSLYRALRELSPNGCDLESPVFVARHGKPITRQRAWQIIKKAAKNAGINQVSPHWFRHAHASHALRHGASLPLVQQTLGHADISTTGVYVKVEPTESSSTYVSDVE